MSLAATVIKKLKFKFMKSGRKKKKELFAKQLLLFASAQETDSWKTGTQSIFPILSVIKLYVLNWGLHGN